MATGPIRTRTCIRCASSRARVRWASRWRNAATSSPLYRDRERSSADVKAIAANHVAEIDEKIESLRAMRATLSTLMRKCHGDERPDCPIIEELASGAAPETDAK